VATAAKSVAEVCREAKDASHLLARAGRAEKDTCLRDLADRIDASVDGLLEANRADVDAG
jgi:gamma-glutamyl phosphate reductase